MTTVAARTTPAPKVSSPARSLGALALDVGLPLATYFVAKDVLGLSLVGALIAGSVPPVLTSLASYARARTISPVSALMLIVNVAGIAVSFLAGGPRLIFAKDSVVSSVFGLTVLVSALRGRPVMSEGLRPFLTRGHAARDATWNRLSATCAEFRRYEKRYSVIWGSALLADCLARLAVALLAPLSVLGWASTPIIVGAIIVAVIVSGGVACDPMQKMIEADAAQPVRNSAL